MCLAGGEALPELCVHHSNTPRAPGAAPCPHPRNNTEPWAVLQVVDFELLLNGSNLSCSGGFEGVFMLSYRVDWLVSCSQSPCLRDKFRPSLYSPVNAQGRGLTWHNPVPGRGGAGNLCDSAWWDFMSHQSRTKSSLSLPHTSGESLVLLWHWDFSCLTGNLQGWALGRACPGVCLTLLSCCTSFSWFF